MLVSEKFPYCINGTHKDQEVPGTCHKRFYTIRVHAVVWIDNCKVVGKFKIAVWIRNTLQSKMQ